MTQPFALKRRFEARLSEGTRPALAPAIFGKEAHESIHGREVGGIDELAGRCDVGQQAARSRCLEMKRQRRWRDVQPLGDDARRQTVSARVQPTSDRSQGDARERARPERGLPLAGSWRASVTLGRQRPRSRESRRTEPDDCGDVMRVHRRSPLEGWRLTCGVRPSYGSKSTTFLEITKYAGECSTDDNLSNLPDRYRRPSLHLRRS